MKKLISICLAAIISIGLVPIYASAAQSGYASPPAKDGYTLAPLQYSASGIDVSSAFILTTPANTTADQLNGTLTIDGQPMPVIKQNTSREFIVTPLVTLASNSLYIFRLARSAASDGGPDITWAFQTAVKFQITSSFPRNEATNVPRNCGIEITFSCEDFSKIDEFFSISPNVAGRYEYHKDTAVFVPRALSYSTVYTVTLKAGVTLKGTGEKLLDDYVFSFETEPAPDYVPPPSYDSISFHSGYGELPSIEPPMIGYLAYHRGPEQRPDPTVAVYKFNSTDQAISAAKTLAWLPSWSSYAKYDSLLDVNTLSKIAAFEISDIASNSYSGYMVLPDKLQPGFYLVEATYGASRDQMVIQINDLPVQVIADGTKSLIWVNDIATGKGAAGASVYDQIDGKTYRTDANGVATIDRVVKNNKDERFDITSPNGKTCIWLNAPSYVYIPIYSSYGGGYQISPGSANEAYRTAMQLDRTLFKSDDTLSFFGFVQDRNDKEHIDSVTAIMTEAYRFYSSRDILYTQTVPVVDGIYSDEIELPNLDAGYYCLTIYHGSIALNSTYFSVQDYVKPPYKIDVSADKKAVFADDTITFAVKAGFFEGTPVSDLDVSYRITSNFGALESPIYSQAKTDIDGMVDTTVTVVPRSTAQGMSSITFTAEATLPEIGRTTKSVSVRSFINDIDINAKTSRIGKDASISVDVNSITLDRLNNGTAKDYYDYLDKPIAQKTINVEIYRAYYVKFKSGDYYDFIEKKVLPRYFYSLETEKIDSFSIATDEDGHAEKDFTVPNRDFEGYYANITCIDGNGRTMSYRLYIGHDYSSYYNNADTNELYLDGTETSYAVGDAINLTLKRGVDEVVRGNFLYVTLMRGIKSYQAGKNRYESIFTTDYIPNATVYLYYFNGFNYQSGYYGMRAPLRYDYSAGNLTLTAVTDKESYKPGDMCTITIEAKDADGNAKPADINISIVDEALFALRNYTVDTLASVYRSVSTGLRFSASTHRGYLPSLEMLEYVEYSIDEDVPMMSLPTTGSDEDDTYLREIFKDTAYFETMRSNAQGTATYTFKLPDNITSWRLTVSAIGSPSSGSITYAGNTVQNIIVTNPMFINYTLNDEFLAGDAPTIGVNVYGTSLAGGETVTFEVWDEKMPEKKQTASGVAFERVNIPLWEMTDEGANALIIKATVSNGTSDAIKHQYQVIKTYRQIDEAEYYDVDVDTVFSVGKSGLTNITFTDKGRGAFLRQLINMLYAYGDRVERLLVRREANKLIDKYFPDLEIYSGKDSFDIKQYQQSDGGIAILPYAESDLETTVKLMPYTLDEVNLNSLKRYLYNMYEGDNAGNKMCALYGLAMLKEPILLDLDRYALLDELSVIDAVYVALAYCALGETGTAADIYDGKIAPRLDFPTPYIRVYTGIDNDDILSATSAATMLASILDKPEKDGLYNYCIDNYTTDILINIEKLTHIEREIAKRTDERGSITYSLFDVEYTRTLDYGNSYTLRFPVAYMDRFRLVDVSGDVGAVSVYKKTLDEIGETDTDILVRRRYYKANDLKNSTYEFEQGDLIRVQVWIDYTAKAINGSYCVTDYLPAGLQYVDYSAKISGAPTFGYGYFRYCTVEGQQVTFYDYNGRFNRGYLYYYYARVISPGTFIAEGPLVQNLTASGVYTVGEDSTLTIT